jgi:enoyl-CoA hydratase/carnithine racemase
MNILVDLRKRVLHLVLNRPEKRNALSAALCAELVQQVDSIQHNPDVGSVLISANGSVFCAGMDLEEAREDHGFDLEKVHEDLFTMGSRSLKPIVVCVNGAALGGGLGLVAQGHVVMCSEIAAFGLTEIKVGFWPFLAFRSVADAIGQRRALELSLTGCLFHPREAVDWGLVHRVCPAAEVMDRAKVVARELGKASPEAIRGGLTYVRDARDKSQEEAGRIAAVLRAQVLAGDDFKEGLQAFHKKREAHWPSMPKSFYSEHVS